MSKQSYAQVLSRILLERAKRDMSLDTFHPKSILLDSEKSIWDELGCAVAFNFYQLSQNDDDIRHLGKGRYCRVGGAKSTKVSNTKRIMEF